MPDPQRYRVASENIIHDTIENEVILLNLETGTYYQLKQNSVPIWNALAQTVPAGDILARFAEKYSEDSDTVQSSITDFIHELEQEGLLAPYEPETGAQAPSFALPAEAPAEFVAPALLKYTDMQSLLLLDPIHDVDAAGWPLPKPDEKAV